MSNSPLAITVLLYWGLLASLLFVLLVSTVLILRGGRVAGPDRWAPGEPIQSLLGLTILGMAVWVLVPAFYAQNLHRDLSGEVAAPTTAARSAQFTPSQTVGVSLASALIVCGVLLAGNLIFRPGGLRRLGLAAERLPRGAMIGLAACVLILPLCLLTAMLTDKLWDLAGYKHPGAHEMLLMLAESDDPDFRRLIYLSAIVVAPFFEELLFRGHLQTLTVQFTRAALDRQLSTPSHESLARWIGIFIASAIFTLVHGALWMMPPIFLLSLCLGYLYERSGNLWSVIVVHMIFNAGNVAVFVKLAVH